MKQTRLITYNKKEITKSIKAIVGKENYSHPAIVGYIISVTETDSYTDKDKVKIINLLFAMREMFQK